MIVAAIVGMTTIRSMHVFVIVRVSMLMLVVMIVTVVMVMIVVMNVVVDMIVIVVIVMMSVRGRRISFAPKSDGANGGHNDQSDAAD